MEQNKYLQQLYHDINGPTQKTLQDCIQEYRKISDTSDKKQFINVMYQNTMNELQKSNETNKKVIAAEKLLFLINERVEGCSQASFDIIQLMGSTNQVNVKQIAYLIAPFILKNQDDSENENLILLTPNIFIKDFQNLQGHFQIPSISINCLSAICDPELSSQIYREIFPLFTCSNAHIRKKTCALCYKIFIHSGENDEIISELVPYLTDRLQDSEASVRMAAISAIYEITKINQTLFVVSIPAIYTLLCQTTNNWVLIKLIKLLTEFCEIETRLVNKMKPKFLNLLEQQKAKSVQFEVLKALLKIYKNDKEMLSLGIKILNKDFLEMPDPNLRFLGFQMLSQVIDDSNKAQIGPKIMELFKVEKEPSILNKLVELMKIIIDLQNYEYILTSLFDRFKVDQNLQVIRTILEISNNYNQNHQFQKFFILYILIPLLDVYSNQSHKLNQKHQEILDEILSKITNIFQLTKNQVLLDWCVKSINFQLTQQKPIINNYQILLTYLNIVQISNDQTLDLNLTQLVETMDTRYKASTAFNQCLLSILNLMCCTKVESQITSRILQIANTYTLNEVIVHCKMVIAKEQKQIQLISDKKVTVPSCLGVKIAININEL